MIKIIEYTKSMSFLCNTSLLVFLLTFSSLVTQGQVKEASDSSVMLSTPDSIEAKMYQITDYIIDVFRKKYSYQKRKDMYYMWPLIKYYLYNKSEFPIQKPYRTNYFVYDYNKDSNVFKNTGAWLNSKYNDFNVSKTESSSVSIDKVIFNLECNKVAISFTLRNGPHSLFSTDQILIENEDKTWSCETILHTIVE